MLGRRQKARQGRPSSPQGRFGVALCKKRIKAQLSQRELGVIMGVHRVTIARWEGAARLPHYKTARFKAGLWMLDKLAKASDFERRKILIEKGIV